MWKLQWKSAMLKLAFVVFLAGFALPTTEKQKVNVTAAKANTGWALPVPSITAHSRERASSSADFAKRMQHA